VTANLAQAGALAAAPVVAPRRGLLWRRFLRHPAAMFGLLVLLALAVVSVAGNALAPHNPSSQAFDPFLKPFRGAHLLGTDDVGRDVLSRLLVAARPSLVVALLTVVLASAVALPLGLIAGYAGRWPDAVISRLMDALFAFPPLVLALAVASLLGAGVINGALAISAVFVPGFVRLVRAQVLAVREETYIEAAVSLGATPTRIVRRHVLPNVASPLVVQAALSFGYALLAEAGLSYLGLGPGGPSWGDMLHRSFASKYDAPLGVVWPGLAITITVLACNLVGDGLRDSLGIDAGSLHPYRPARHRPRVRVPAPRTPPDDGPALSVRGLSVELAGHPVITDVTFDVHPGETVGLVGESGCGKTITALGIMGLLPARVARVSSGEVLLTGRDLVAMSTAARRALQGDEIAMIFQEPMTSLNPAFSVGEQIAELVRTHRGASRRAAWARAVEMLDRVGIPDAARRAKEYPHRFSGGMRQRVMIAMALACDPQVLIADEPTTALDVTVQAQILELLRSLQQERGMAVVFVTHDLGVVAEICDRVVVMYAGQVVEHGTAAELFARPAHPYTRALLASLPQTVAPHAELHVIPGQVPSPAQYGSTCRFAPRCAHVTDRCAVPVPLVHTAHRQVRCVRADELALAEAHS
jgi:peptide/nickel transport system permease protein